MKQINNANNTKWANIEYNAQITLNNEYTNNEYNTDNTKLMKQITHTNTCVG